MSSPAPRARVLLVACGFALLAYAAAAPNAGSVLLALLFGALGVLLTGPPVRLTVPRWVAALATIAILLRTVSLALADGLDIHDFAEFVAWMMVVKVFDRRSSSDDAQLLALSVFLCVAAMLVSNGLAVAVLSFVYLPCIAYAAMHVQLRVSLERAQRLASRGAGGAAPEVRAAAGAGAAAAMRRTSIAGVSIGFAIAAVVFVVLPRGAGLQQIGQWGNPSVGRVVGFASRVRTGIGGVISTSNTPVLHLRLTDSDDRTLGGLGAVRYLRGAVLDVYDGGIWSPSREPSTIPGAQERQHAGETEGLDGRGADATLYQHVTLLNTPRDFSYVFTIWRPTEITFEDAVISAVDRTLGTVMVGGRGGKFRYRVRSAALQRLPMRGSPGEPPSWPSPTVNRVAGEILAGADLEPDPAQRSIADNSFVINAFRRYFWSNYTYSLESPPPPRGVDPTDWFLTEADSGHCEYYASALAALCRSVGIPARVVTGYVAAEYNAATGHYVVRESNAHAWVEAQVEPGVWKQYDATPPTDLLAQHGPDPGLLARAGRALDAINYAWVNSVVSFDGEDRSDLLGWSDPLSGAVSRRISLVLDVARLAPPRVLVSAVVRITLAIVGGAVACVVIIRVLRRVRAKLARRPRALPRRIADQEARERVRAMPLYQEMLTVLLRAGVRKPDWQPPLAWAESLGERSEPLARTVEGLSELYYVMRFGGRDLTSPERERALRLLDELRALLRGGQGG